MDKYYACYLERWTGEDGYYYDVEEVDAVIAKMQAEIDALKKERDGYLSALVEFGDFAICEHCGSGFPIDEFFVYTDESIPTYCESCAEKIGWRCNCDEESNFHLNDDTKCFDCKMERETGKDD